MLLCYDVVMQTLEKRRTTIYISPEVLEFLSIRRIRGLGSVSQQIENLARQEMPRNLALLEQQHRAGYDRIPANDEFSDLITAQPMDLDS
jgi:hypothetical protein